MASTYVRILCGARFYCGSTNNTIASHKIYTACNIPTYNSTVQTHGTRQANPPFCEKRLLFLEPRWFGVNHRSLNGCFFKLEPRRVCRRLKNCNHRSLKKSKSQKKNGYFFKLVPRRVCRLLLTQR